MARPPYRVEQRNWIFARFVNAANEIIDSGGVEALTLRRVAQQAGYNSATLYNYFNDLDHLIAYASVKYLQAYQKMLPARLNGIEDRGERLLAMWAFFCREAFRQPRVFHSLFYGRYSGQLEEIVQTYYQVFSAECERMGEQAGDMCSGGSLFQRSMQYLRPILYKMLLFFPFPILRCWSIIDLVLLLISPV